MNCIATSDSNVYLGPQSQSGSVTLDGSGEGTITLKPISGYVDAVYIVAAHSVNASAAREVGSEVIWAKTGVTSSGARPAALEQKSSDGSDLTTYRRIFVYNEAITLTLASGTAGDVIEFTVVCAPNR